jgi:hypothetical protein
MMTKNGPLLLDVRAVQMDPDAIDGHRCLGVGRVQISRARTSTLNDND